MNVTDVPMYSDNELTAACRHAAAQAAAAEREACAQLARDFGAVYPEKVVVQTGVDRIDWHPFAGLLAGTADGYAHGTTPEQAKLTAVYDWLAAVVAFPFDFTFGDKPPWLDMRMLAEAWHRHEPDEDAAIWLLALCDETGWDE